MDKCGQGRGENGYFERTSFLDPMTPKTIFANRVLYIIVFTFFNAYFESMDQLVLVQLKILNFEHELPIYIVHIILYSLELQF